MRYRNLGPGWVFVPLFIILTITILFVLSGKADAIQVPCPDPARPVHYLPFCLTEAEYVALTAPPPPPPAPTPHSVDLVERWRPIVAHFWGKHGVTDRMLRIMRCESGGDPWAWNKSTDVRGLFQVRYPLWSKLWPGDYFDPWTNAAIAYQVWLEQGFRAWACRG